MIVKKSGGKVFGAVLTRAEQKAMDLEIQRQWAEYTRKGLLEIDAVFLWYLHEEFGFGIERLKRVFMGFAPRIKEMCDRYDMHDESDKIWLCLHKLKEYGVDLEEWDKERGD